MTYWILDPPDAYAPLSSWYAWLEKLRRMPQDDPGVAEEIADAERWIPKRKELESFLQKPQAAQKAA
jgi:hypothetical protein